MTVGVRSANLPIAPLVEVFGHFDAGGGQKSVGRDSLQGLVDQLRGIISTDPSGVATLRADLQRQIQAAQDSIAASTAAYKEADAGLQRSVGALATSKADATALVALATLVGLIRSEFGTLSARPGDTPDAFTFVSNPAALAGPRTALPPLPASLIASGDNGPVASMVGAGVIGMRRAQAIELGRLYRPRAVYQRRANPSDPTGDAVVFMVVLLDQQFVAIGSVVVAQPPALTVASGRQAVESTVSRSPGAGAVLPVLPPGTRFAVGCVITYGLDGVTDVEAIDIDDVTDAFLLPAPVADFEARLAEIESRDIDPRLTVVESALTAPTSVRYATKSDAGAATIPDSARVVELMGRVVSGDGGAGLYSRTTGPFSVLGDTFVSHGVTWTRVDQSYTDGAANDFPLPSSPRFREWAFITENDQVTGNGTSDDTAGVANAIERFSAQGREILIPDNCKIRLTSEIVTSRPVRLGGKSPVHLAPGSPYPGYGPTTPGSGSYFVHDHLGPMMIFKGAATPTLAPIGSVALKNIGVVQNQPAYAQDGTFTPLDSDFAFVFDNCHYRAKNIDFLNVSRAITVKRQSGFGSLLGMRGQPLRCGLDVRDAYNPQNAREVTWWPWWSLDAPVLAWMQANAIGFRSGRHDNPNWDASFALGYYKGIEFYQYDGSDGGAGGCTNRFSSTRFDMDASADSLYIHPGVTDLVAHFGYLGGFKTEKGGEADPNFHFSGAARVHIGCFDPGPSRGPLLLVDGNGCEVVIETLLENRWDTSGKGAPAFQVLGTNNSVRIKNRIKSRNTVSSYYAVGSVQVELSRKKITATPGSTFGEVNDVQHGAGLAPGYVRVEVLGVNGGANNDDGIKGFCQSFNFGIANLLFTNAKGQPFGGVPVTFVVSTGFDDVA